MRVTMGKSEGIQVTLFDYFCESDQFTLKQATEVVNKVKDVKQPSIRARIYEGIDSGLFERVDKGVYKVTRKNKNGEDANALLINGDGRDLSSLEDSSMDAIITDHPYDISKTLDGGNRAFATYERFCYTIDDFKEKARVLKPGCFLVEFVPEESADNYEYLYQIKEYARKSGLEYYAKVSWKKGDFVANTGRKSKNTEDILFFTKGKCRNLRLDAKKNMQLCANMMFYDFEENYNPLIPSENPEDDVIHLKYMFDVMDARIITEEIHAAYKDWMGGCTQSILKNSEMDQDLLCQIPIGEYIDMWLAERKYFVLNVTDKIEEIHFAEQNDKKLQECKLDLLMERAPEKLNYMSGTKGMLPTVFDVQPPGKKERVHQAEKPVELLEQIIEFTTLPREKILDQFAGSYNLSKAALNMNRDSIAIEINQSYFDDAVKRIGTTTPRIRHGR